MVWTANIVLLLLLQFKGVFPTFYALESEMNKTFDLNIRSATPLIAPQTLKSLTPPSQINLDTVVQSREIIKAIIAKRDRRLLAIVGPCSIHNRDAALAYAKKLQALGQRVKSRVYIVMRVYFEKPRTALGWRGLILDPHLDGSNDIAHGLRLAREILLEITAMGVPAASEMLDPIVPQYIDELISWAAIGARTTESQTHREMASGLSVPVGFKNGTDGNYEGAVNALKSSRSSHSFLDIDQQGGTCILETAGNPDSHIISRGGSKQPNYSPEEIARAEGLLRDAGIEPAILVDCSHGNSGKKHEKQEEVLKSLLFQRQQGVDTIIGFMLESNLGAGRQEIPQNVQDLKFGVSVTDPCIDWDSTERLIELAYERSGGA